MIYHDTVKKLFVVAHSGDSRSVLCKGKEGKAIELTEDHKPNLPKEKARIEKGGGRVVFDGFWNHRVFARGQRYPGLNMSRALGDVVAHQEAGLSAEPDVLKVTHDGAEHSNPRICQSQGAVSHRHCWESMTPPSEASWSLYVPLVESSIGIVFVVGAARIWNYQLRKTSKPRQ